MAERSCCSDFDTLARLGQGSFGTVFMVRRIKDDDGQLYVIKKVRIKELNKKERDEAINEVTLLARINSVYIVHYYDSFIEEDNLHIVMEYCNKGDLQGLIRKAKDKGVACLKEQVTWNVALQVILGLHYLHEEKILHRDLKSANVFLAKEPPNKAYMVKIGDLGVAKLLETSTAFARTIVGTPYYLSPELCEDKPYRDKSDCWALGVMLHECCTLRHPFDAKNQMALILKIIKNPVAPLPTDTVSACLGELIMWLLQKDPRDRPCIRDILCEQVIRDKLAEQGFELPRSLLSEPVTYRLSPTSSFHHDHHNEMLPHHHQHEEEDMWHEGQGGDEEDGVEVELEEEEEECLDGTFSRRTASEAALAASSRTTAKSATILAGAGGGLGDTRRRGGENREAKAGYREEEEEEEQCNNMYLTARTQNESSEGYYKTARAFLAPSEEKAGVEGVGGEGGEGEGVGWRERERTGSSSSWKSKDPSVLVPATGTFYPPQRIIRENASLLTSPSSAAAAASAAAAGSASSVVAGGGGNLAAARSRPQQSQQAKPVPKLSSASGADAVRGDRVRGSAHTKRTPSSKAMTRNQIKTNPLSVAGGGLLSRDFRSESKGTVHEDDDEKEMADYFGEDGEATISRQAKFGGDNRTGEARGSVGGEEKDAESGAKATSSSSSSTLQRRASYKDIKEDPHDSRSGQTASSPLDYEEDFEEEEYEADAFDEDDELFEESYSQDYRKYILHEQEPPLQMLMTPRLNGTNGSSHHSSGGLTEAEDDGLSTSMVLLDWIAKTRQDLSSSLGEDLFNDIYSLCEQNMIRELSKSPSKGPEDEYLREIQHRLEVQLNAGLEVTCGYIMQTKALLAWEDELYRRSKDEEAERASSPR